MSDIVQELWSFCHMLQHDSTAAANGRGDRATLRQDYC